MPKVKMIPKPKSTGGKLATYTPTAEIEICLNCPLPNCNAKYVCKRFKEERNKIKGK